MIALSAKALTQGIKVGYKEYTRLLKEMYMESIGAIINEVKTVIENIKSKRTFKSA